MNCNGHANTDGYLEDYCDGDKFKSHPLFSFDLRALQIFFYYDDVEIVNPLGSKRSKHKVGALNLLIVFHGIQLCIYNYICI